MAKTNRENGLLVPQDWLGIVYYVAHECVKLRYLARIIRGMPSRRE